MKSRFRHIILRCVVFFLFFLILTAYFYIVFPFWGKPFNARRHGRPPVTPPWALECWLWEDEANSAAQVDELLEGYAAHDIPVRTILIDSPWSTRYNDFIVDENRYADPEVWFRDLKDRGYRIVLWMTCMVNSQNDDTAIRSSREWFDSARRAGYLAGDGYQIGWWKGRGGFVDYTNPDALMWWHQMQQKLFDYGIDGWKLDGCATFFSSKIGSVLLPYQRTHRGWKTTRGYMDLYYRQEYFHGLSRNPEFVTLVRSIDRPYIHPEGFAPLDAAPATWVGDQRHAWKSGHPDPDDPGIDRDLMMTGDEGIEEALRDILLSARLGYCVTGSDIAGFSGSYIPPRLYIRWAQLSAFCGLFLNGGHGVRALWKRSRQELEIIRKFSWLHTELGPYIYTHVVLCHNGGKPLQRPLKGKYHYLFGDDFLVAPIYQDSLINAVILPDGRWRYFFRDSELHVGPVTFAKEFPLDEYPVYVREGAIIPLKVTRSYTGLGDEGSSDYLTFLIYPSEHSSFTLYDPKDNQTTTVRVDKDEESVSVGFSGTKKAHILRLFSPEEPVTVVLDGKPLSRGERWRYRMNDKHLLIKTETYSGGDYQIGY